MLRQTPQMAERRPDNLDERHEGCCCASLPDLAVVPMGGDGLDERVFATLDRICDHGGNQWWLYLSTCNACGQNWMVAQEERIYDDYYLRRLNAEVARQIKCDGRWPGEFITYERVLRIGRTLSQPFIYLDSLSPALAATVDDLRQERPNITVEEMAYLLGITSSNVTRLLAA